MIRKLCASLAAGVVCLFVFAQPVSAHPLGNFTVNTAAALRVTTEGIVVEFAIDLAEIPTLQARADMDTNGDGTISDSEQLAFRDRECARVGASQHVTVDGVPVALIGQGRSFALIEGLASLSTTRITCTVSGNVDLHAGGHVLVYDSSYAAGHAGWHEVTAQGDGMRLNKSDVPEVSTSLALTQYPAGAIKSPPDVRHAQLRVEPGGAALIHNNEATAASPIRSSLPGVDGATRSFANLVRSRDLTVRLGLLSVAVAFVLGIFHAMAPGHGKTVMAAYLVGQRGNLRQALGVGAGVTLTHTAGVLVLGLILSASTVAAPERLYPWLGTASGLMLASIGLGLLVRARRLHRLGVANIWHSHAPGGHGHVHSDWLDVPVANTADARVLVAAGGSSAHRSHAHDHHEHGDHAHAHTEHGGHDHVHHDHPHGGHGGRDLETGDNAPAQDMAAHPVMGWRWIVAMGFAGGMVPSPSALVVLLGAVALGRTWFGVALVSSYGIGMATTLVVAGLLLVRARVHIERLVASERGQRMTRLLSVLPMITAVVIVIGGLLVAARALRSM